MMDHSLLLPEARGGAPASPDLLEARRKVAGLAAIQVAAAGIEQREVLLGGVACLDVGAAGDPVLLYAHGGGFRMGSPETWFGLASRIACSTPSRTASPALFCALKHRRATNQPTPASARAQTARSEEHTSELQSH